MNSQSNAFKNSLKQVNSIPTKRVSWEELQGNIIVWRGLDDTGALVRYYRMGKQNNKSAWLSACDKSGEIYSITHPCYEHERHSRSHIPRAVLLRQEQLMLSN
jgi:hypothetical protein